MNNQNISYAEEQAAKAQRKADSAWKKTMKDAKVYVDADSRLPRFTKEVAGDQLLARLNVKLDEIIAAANKEMAKFTDRLSQDSVNAFEWSDGAFNAAASLSVARGIQAWLERFSENEDDYSRHSSMKKVQLVRHELFCEIMMEARNPSRSTSQPHNITHQSMLSARAKLLEELNQLMDYVSHPSFDIEVLRYV